MTGEPQPQQIDVDVALTLKVQRLLESHDRLLVAARNVVAAINPHTYNGQYQLELLQDAIAKAEDAERDGADERGF
jgi:hypothetical protein